VPSRNASLSLNKSANWKNIDVLGIVTNGSTWNFYKLTPEGQVYESLPYALGTIAQILGLLHYVFEQCQQNLNGS